MNEYRIHINRDACVGDGMCRETAPQTFGADSEGKSIVIDPNGDEPRHVKEAARSCRLEAIRLLDDDTGGCIWPPE